MPTKNIKIRPTIAVVCDDIRQEATNKPFIIGIYPSDINVSLPEDAAGDVALPLSLWMPFKLSKAGTVSVEIMFVGPNPANKVKLNGELIYEKAPAKGEITAISYGGIPIKMDQSGELEILFRNKGEDDWETVRTIPVNIKRIPNPSPPSI